MLAGDYVTMLFGTGKRNWS